MLAYSKADAGALDLTGLPAKTVKGNKQFFLFVPGNAVAVVDNADPEHMV